MEKRKKANASGVFGNHAMQKSVASQLSKHATLSTSAPGFCYGKTQQYQATSKAYSIRNGPHFAIHEAQDQFVQSGNASLCVLHRYHHNSAQCKIYTPISYHTLTSPPASASNAHSYHISPLSSVSTPSIPR